MLAQQTVDVVVVAAAVEEGHYFGEESCHKYRDVPAHRMRNSYNSIKYVKKSRLCTILVDKIVLLHVHSLDRFPAVLAL